LLGEEEEKMSPDFAFALTLIVKMAITAGFVLAATVIAERVGPLVGGLVATLPIGAGPVYVFLALDHDADFIAQSAVASLAINAVNVIFALAYALLAQRSRGVTLPVAFLIWGAGAVITHWRMRRRRR
jgi:Ca2+/H+ antiporter